MRKPFWVLLALMMCLTGCSKQLFQKAESPAPELILRYAENQPKDYPTTQAAYVFARMVEEQTGGRVRIRVYCDGELGNEGSVVEQMTFGGIDFSRVSLSQLSELEDSLNVLFLPYLYRNEAQMWRVLDGPIGEEYLTALESQGILGLSWFDAGVRCFYTTTPVNNFQDLAELRLRVQDSAIMSSLVESLGAEPVQMAYGEVYAALQQHKIDGAENNLPSYIAMRHYNIAPYLLMDNHCRIPEMQIISATAMKKLAELDESFPEIIRSCARESAEIQRRLWQQTQEDARRQVLDAGCIVTILGEEEKAWFRQTVQGIYPNDPTYREIIARIQAT